MSRRLKLLLVGLSGLVLLLVAAALAIPFLFRDRLDALLRAYVNASVDATVDWQTLDLSLVRGFPHLGVTARGLRICNRAPFDGLCLAEIDELSARLSLVSLLRDVIDVRSVSVRRPRVRLSVREDGLANWQITRRDSAPPDAHPSGLRIALRDYAIEDAHVVYANLASDLAWELAGLSHRGHGDFSRYDVALATTSHADRANLALKGVRYLRDARVDVDADARLDVPAGRVTIHDSEIRLNDLTLGLEGAVGRHDDGLALDDRSEDHTRSADAYLAGVSGEGERALPLPRLLG